MFNTGHPILNTTQHKWQIAGYLTIVQGSYGGYTCVPTQNPIREVIHCSVFSRGPSDTIHTSNTTQHKSSNCRLSIPLCSVPMVTVGGIGVCTQHYQRSLVQLGVQLRPLALNCPCLQPSYILAVLKVTQRVNAVLFALH